MWFKYYIIMTCREYGEKAPLSLNLRTTAKKYGGQNHDVERKMTFLPNFIKTGHSDEKFALLFKNGGGGDLKVWRVSYISPSKTSILFRSQDLK
jgi:hypothetical protein